jgi:hypothetical protein
MIELVLRDPRWMPFELEPHVLAVLVLALERHAQMPLDGNGDALKRKAAFVLGLRLVAALRELRIDGRDHVVLVFLEDEDALQDAHLRRRETDAARVVHQLAHPRDEPLQVLVERRDVVAAHPQHGIAVLTDLRERELPPRLRLGVELRGLLDDLAFDVVCHDAQCSGHG